MFQNCLLGRLWVRSTIEYKELPGISYLTQALGVINNRLAVLKALVVVVQDLKVYWKYGLSANLRLLEQEQVDQNSHLYCCLRNSAVSWLPWGI